jgi:methylmalonyl-CoA/ethylmalonyl-CoA epimerase
MKMEVHHIGIVVDDIDQAKGVYEEMFGLEITGRFMFNAECAFIPVGNTYLELVRPTADDGLKKFLEKHGSGKLHHICYIVDDMEEAWEYFQKKGLRSVTGEPKYTPSFEKVMFFHPKDTGNVLIELGTRAACPLPTK